LIFKGSGFYITDYRSEGYKSAAKSDTAAAAAPAAAPAASESTKTAEPKPAAKTGGEGKSAAQSKKTAG
jgi:hypothetical protein